MSCVTANSELRVDVLTRALLGVVTNAEAAAELKVTIRHLRRLKRSFERRGPAALVHGNRGRQPVHRVPDDLRARLVQLATTTYAGVSHQRLSALLAEKEQVMITRSTLRRVLLSGGVRSPHQRRARLRPGVMPVAFDLTHRRVDLLDLAGADFRESFFQQTVDQRLREQPRGLRASIDLEAFVAAARLEPGRPPDGFIFHVGRCDSTLVANLLSSWDEHIVIKEARAVNALLAGLLSVAGEAQRGEREGLVAQALSFMFRPSRGTERRLFYSLSSWNARLAATLLRLFPSTPAVFLYGTAASTVASMRAQPPGWRRLLDRPRLIQERFFPTLASVSPQTQLSSTMFYAHAWRSAAEAALGLPAERLLVIDNEEMLANLELRMGRVLAHFGVTASQDHVAALCRAQRGSALNALRNALTRSQEAEVLAVVGDLAELLAAHPSRIRTAAPNVSEYGE
jgi:transposase